MTDPDRSVIVAADLGSATDVALRAAHAHAAARGVALIVCHVGDRAMSDGALRGRISTVTDRDAHPEIIVVAGEPSIQIAELARARHAELLVIGDDSNGDNAAERIVREAPCSVLVARPHFGLRVLVATDLSEPSYPVIAAAGIEATRRDVPLTAIHCVAPSSHVPDIVLADAHKQLDSALQRFGVRAEVAVVVGSAAETILNACTGVGADLVVIGKPGRDWLQRLRPGSTVESVVRNAPCSVLVVRT